jgi:hypothetical protein
MRTCLTVFLVSLWFAGATARAQGSCDVAARDVVEHARKKGYRFETVRVGQEGTCDTDASGSIFIASATSRAEVACDVRVFAQRRAGDAEAGDEAGGPGDPPADAPAPPPAEWVIASIRVAGPSASSIYADEDAAGNGGWVFRIRAPQSQTVQYRLDRVEFTTEKDCRQWKDAFGS